jgi:acyl-CoA reductase-like NAD-dependent aldehyde dehydrogenase
VKLILAEKLNIPVHVTQDDDKMKIYTTYQPLGVVGAITPWNFPLVLAINKIAPALLVGDTIIVKPSYVSPKKQTLSCFAKSLQAPLLLTRL